MKTSPTLVSSTLAALALTGCASMSPSMPMSPPQSMPMSSGMAAVYSQDALPDAVKVPAGHKVAWETVGVGEITYECRAKAAATNEYEWIFVGPKAVLNDRNGKPVGKYWGPPATWEAMDGSKLTATQLAVAPAGSGNLPLQLVKANPAMGMGALSGVTHIQRVATRGGTLPGTPCTSATTGLKTVVNYQADYIFWKAA